MTTDRLRHEKFTKPAGRVRPITQLILRHVRPEDELRLLDLGCGTGEQLFALAEALPRAHLTGLDTSERSVSPAQEVARSRGVSDRVVFHAGDYMDFEAPAFDLILADTVLHAIPVPTERLFAKLVADLAPGGLLIYTMPAWCLYNRALALARRGFRAAENPMTDALVLTIARALHGRRYSAESLRERIPYMYLVPDRYDGPDLHHLLRSSYGLELVENTWLPHASVAQMKHRVAVFRKRQG